jgi:hypothetical protein
VCWVSMIVSKNRPGTSTVRFNTEGKRERDKSTILLLQRLSSRAVCRGVERSMRSRILFDPQEKRSTYLCSQVPGQPGEITWPTCSVEGDLMG